MHFRYFIFIQLHFQKLVCIHQFFEKSASAEMTPLRWTHIQQVNSRYNSANELRENSVETLEI